MSSPRAIALFTHRHPAQTDAALKGVMDAARRAGVDVRLPDEECEKHRLPEADRGIEQAEIAVVLGGDGTILRALRAFAGRKVPVFAVNFGEIGFLSTVDRSELEVGIERALKGDFEVLSLPALAIDLDGTESYGVNDISLHRHSEKRVAELGYSVGQDQLGRVRCDGLVASTPAGSTGYNLANGGPVLAWGVEGFVVSFVAPHTLTARALVVAPSDALTIENLSVHESVAVTTDGRFVGDLGPGQTLDVRFVHDQALLAQVPGSSFYHRLREKFGRLAT